MGYLLAAALIVGSVAGCGSGGLLNGDDGVNGPRDRHYSVGDIIDAGEYSGYYCGFFTANDGAADIPDARHFTVFVEHTYYDCNNAIKFFEDFVQSRTSVRYSDTAFVWNGNDVSYSRGDAGDIGLLHAGNISGYHSPYGDLSATAVGW